MKKFIALFLAVFFLGINECFAFSEVYYLKNVKVSTIQPSVINGFYSQNYKLIKQNPYYGKSTYNSGDYAVVILQQSGDNMFFYYQSNSNKKINKYILNSAKRAGITYEQSYNTNIINIYDNLAKKVMSSENTNTYVFNDNSTDFSTSDYSNASSNNQTKASNSLKGYVANVESGTKIGVYLQSAINTSTAVEGDRIIAVLTSDLKYKGYTVAPQGSLVYGILTKARHATYGSRNGRVVIDFNQLVTPDGKTYNIDTEKIDFTVTNDGKIGRTVQDAAVGALVGALTGLVVGAFSGDLGTATAIGAGIGAGGALIGDTAQKGVDAEIPSFTEMEIILTKPFSTTVSY